MALVPLVTDRTCSGVGCLSPSFRENSGVLRTMMPRRSLEEGPLAPAASSTLYRLSRFLCKQIMMIIIDYLWRPISSEPRALTKTSGYTQFITHTHTHACRTDADTDTGTHTHTHAHTHTQIHTQQLAVLSISGQNCPKNQHTRESISPRKTSHKQQQRPESPPGNSHLVCK